MHFSTSPSPAREGEGRVGGFVLLRKVLVLILSVGTLLVSLYVGVGGKAAALPILARPLPQAFMNSSGYLQNDLDPTETPTQTPEELRPSSTPPPTLEYRPTATEPPSKTNPAVTGVPSTTPVDTPTPDKDPSATPDSTLVFPTQALTRTPRPSPVWTLKPTQPFTLTLVVSATQTFTPSPSTTPEPVEIRGPHVPDELIVQFKPKTSNQEIADVFKALEVQASEMIPGVNVWLIRLPDEKLELALGALLAEPRVRFAEPNYLAVSLAVPDDPGLKQQDYLETIQMPAAWDLTHGSPSVLIAVVDTGVDLSHPDLAQQVWRNPGESGQDGRGQDKRSNGKDDDGNGYVDDWAGWNALENDGVVQDRNGHGTGVAGIAAAGTDNEYGMAGVGWDSRLLVVRAVDETGAGGYAQVSKGIVYAARQRARVINLSLGGTNYSRLLEMAVDYAHESGALVVAAAGRDAATYPGLLNKVISVGALNEDNRRAGFSPTGDSAVIYAPGVKLLTAALGGGFDQRSGTSLAAAQVSGVAALMFSLPQFGSAGQIRTALLASSRASGAATEGVRLLQAYRALTYTGAEETLTPAPTPTPTLALTPTEPPGKELAAYPLLPTAVLPPPGPTATPLPSDPHVNYLANTDSCSACHRSHAALGIALRSAWPEETVCFACHTAGGTGTNVQPAFTSYANTATRYFKHDIAASNGVHLTLEDKAANFSGANRHIECEDCHETHDAARGLTYPPMSQYEMGRSAGVDPLWVAAGVPAGYNWLPRADREFQVCFKCHSGFAILPGYSPDGWDGLNYVANGLYKLDRSSGTQKPDYRDLAVEFNPNNASFHPVLTLGRNQSIPAGSFVNGWTQTSLTYCSDCHMNASAATQGVGPHGSPRLHLLDGQSNYSTVDADRLQASGELCFKCHNYTTYVNGGAAANTLFRDGGDNLHTKHTNGERANCYVCHDTHGSEQLHLINFNTQVVTITGVNRDSQNAWEIDTATNARSCFLACHGENHGTGKSYTP